MNPSVLSANKNIDLFIRTVSVDAFWFLVYAILVWFQLINVK